MVLIALTRRALARVARLAAAALGGARRLAVLLRNRRETRRLAEFDDRMLSDIGLTRADVEGALAGPLWDDPSRHLGLRDRERRGLVRLHERSGNRFRPLKPCNGTPAAC
jgi:uncharacterized protein YjiS (DUF1127 family)